ncbi:unnamed protein product [Microthlaspi erraticum]|uniref:Retrotransposon gag domain-containing protein n=1 Tax=Microthlaspi erraticum TaxID=1685480 RepID=A0A6D2IDT4_9BRAS|nr:unnamed protein product [Microthlaspi erraticum]
MNPGGEGAPNRPHNPPDQERRANDPPNPAEARADQPAPARDVPPPIRTRPMQLSRYSHLLTRRDHHRRLQMDIIVTVTTKGCLKTNLTHLQGECQTRSIQGTKLWETLIRPMLSLWIGIQSDRLYLQGTILRSNRRSLPCTTRVNGVSPDYFKCKLFTFSLSDKALRWVKSLPPQSITTWNEYKGAFLNQFYTKQRSNSIRSKISGFKQDSMESFYEASERFKEYTRSCPNHGFSEGNLWNIFYNGIDHKYKLSLDTKSNGNFMTKSVPEAKLLIENLAASDANACPDYNRGVKTTSSSESTQISELRNMVSQLLKSRQGVHAIEDALATNEDTLMDFMRDGAEENLEEVNYIGGNYGNRGFNPPFRAHPNLSYRSNNVENPNDQVYPNQGVMIGFCVYERWR